MPWSTHSRTNSVQGTEDIDSAEAASVNEGGHYGVERNFVRQPVPWLWEGTPEIGEECRGICMYFCYYCSAVDRYRYLLQQPC